MTPTTQLPAGNSSRFVRWRRLAFGVAALVTAFGLVGSYFTAEKRVSGLCASITPGMPLDALRRLAKEKGLGLGEATEGRNLLAEKKTLGRHGCDVLVERGVARSSRYFFADGGLTRPNPAFQHQIGVGSMSGMGSQLLF